MEEENQKRFTGSGLRYHWREYGAEAGTRWEVYTPGLNQVAECLSPENAKLVCDALNATEEDFPITDPFTAARHPSYDTLAKLLSSVRSNAVEGFCIRIGELRALAWTVSALRNAGVKHEVFDLIDLSQEALRRSDWSEARRESVASALFYAIFSIGLREGWLDDRQDPAPVSSDRPEIFSPPDMEHASETFGAMCGHGALAAAIGERVMITEHLFQRPGGWVNLPQMREAIANLPCHRIVREEEKWPPGGPEMRLILIQFTGPWMAENRPPAARCRHRHWIAAKGSYVWDANHPEWIHMGLWRENILPELLPESGNGGWQVFRVLVLEFNENGHGN